MKTTRGKQIGVIVYDKSLNYRAWINEYINRGYVVVICDGYATIHES